MKSLSKEDSQRQDDLVRQLNEHAATIREQIDAVQAAIAELNGAIAEYNGIVDDAVEFRDEIVAKMDDYMDERSEGWQTSESGEAYSSWKDDWEGLELNRVDTIDDIEVDGIGAEGDSPAAAEALEGASTGPAD